MKAINKITGEILKINPKVARVRRLQKRVKAWADLTSGIKQENRLVMITLTYEKVEDYQSGHIRNFMLKVRKELSNNLYAYAWVGELQKRGAVHYHVVLLVRRGTIIPKPDEAGWWSFGMTKIETAKTPYYLLTYTGKKHQKMGDFPKGMRLFAVWVKRDKVSAAARWFFRMSALPCWLTDILKDEKWQGSRVKRAIGGGWLVEGVKFVSPWLVIWYA
jgi:hypothetical protein